VSTKRFGPPNPSRPAIEKAVAGPTWLSPVRIALARLDLLVGIQPLDGRLADREPDPARERRPEKEPDQERDPVRPRPVGANDDERRGERKRARRGGKRVEEDVRERAARH
jgi:hypothetical protein